MPQFWLLSLAKEMTITGRTDCFGDSCKSISVFLMKMLLFSENVVFLVVTRSNFVSKAIYLMCNFDLVFYVTS